jgi:DNA-binding transcriptional ArsR family regulator
MSNGNAGRMTLAWEGDVDHINPEKFEFRAAALRYDPRRAKMLELAAGVGYLTTTVYARAYRELVLVEKDDATFRRLVRRVGRFANVHYYHKDHAAFVAEDLPDHLDFSAVDVDTYGVPGEILQAFFAALAGRRTEPFLLLLTDGGLLAVRRRGEINLYKHYLTGPDEVRPAPEGLAERFEDFHRAFLARLAGRYGFAAKAAGACRNHNQTVLYAAYVITPA